MDRIDIKSRKRKLILVRRFFYKEIRVHERSRRSSIGSSGWGTSSILCSRFGNESCWQSGTREKDISTRAKFHTRMSIRKWIIRFEQTHFGNCVLELWFMDNRSGFWRGNKQIMRKSHARPEWLTCFSCDLGRQDHANFKKTYFNQWKFSYTFFSFATIFNSSPFPKARRILTFQWEKTLKEWHIDVPDLQKRQFTRVPFIIRNWTFSEFGNSAGTFWFTGMQYRKLYSGARLSFAGEPGNWWRVGSCFTPRALYGMFPKVYWGPNWCPELRWFSCGIQENIQVENMEARRGPKENWVWPGREGARIINWQTGPDKGLGKIGNHLRFWMQARQVKLLAEWSFSPILGFVAASKGPNCIAKLKEQR